MTIGQKIKQLRTERKWSQMYLGLESDLSQTTIYQYESGRQNPSLKSFLRLYDAFDISFDEFMKGVDI